MWRLCEYNEGAQCLSKWTERDTKLNLKLLNVKLNVVFLFF